MKKGVKKGKENVTKTRTVVQKIEQLFKNLNILRFFLDNPEREFHIRELERLSTSSVGTVSNYIKKWKTENLIELSETRNTITYRANVHSPRFKKLKLAYNLLLLEESGLIEYLEEEFNHPSCISLFGSYRKAENSSSSDIDIFVVSASKKEVAVSSFERKLGHSIQLFIFSKKSIEEMKEKNPELLNNLVNGIVLSGFFEVF